MFTWCPSLFRPYESAWALTHRFCALNLLSRKECRTLLYDVIKNHKGSPTHVELHPNVLESVLGISQASIETLQSDYYALELFSTPSFYLQYCPECIRVGYHSPLHQSPALKLCPIHRRDLCTICSACGHLISFDMPYLSYDMHRSCNCTKRIFDPDNIRPLLAPLDNSALQTVHSFVCTAHKVRADKRCHSWIFDSRLHDNPDRTAYGLFAKAIDMPKDFCGLFHQTQVRIRSYRGPLNDALEFAEAKPSSSSDLNDFKRDVADYTNQWHYHVAQRMFELCNAIANGNCVITKNDMSDQLGLFARNLRWSTSRTMAAEMGYLRWYWYWIKSQYFDVPLRDESKLTEIANDFQYERHLQVLSSQDRDMWPPAATYKWCLRKLIGALLIGSYEYAITVNRAELQSRAETHGAMHTGIGPWAFPRVYTLWDLESKGSVTMYIARGDLSNINSFPRDPFSTGRSDVWDWSDIWQYAFGEKNEWMGRIRALFYDKSDNRQYGESSRCSLQLPLDLRD